MKLACNSFIVPGKNFGEKLKIIEGWGFEGVEIRVLLDEATPETMDDIEISLSNSPVKVCSIIMPSPAYRMKFDSREAMCSKLEGARIALENGARFGVSAFVTVEYAPQDPLPLWYRRKPLEGLEKELFYEFMGEVADFAEKHSVIALIEPINRYETHFYHTIEEVKAVIDLIGSNWLKIAPDFFHMSIEEIDIPSSLEKGAGYIQHVQMSDSNRELPGRGHIDFTSAFTALRRIGYDGYIAIESRIPEDPDQEFLQSVAYLRRCLEASKNR